MSLLLSHKVSLIQLLFREGGKSSEDSIIIFLFYVEPKNNLPFHVAGSSAEEKGMQEPAIVPNLKELEISKMELDQSLSTPTNDIETRKKSNLKSSQDKNVYSRHKQKQGGETTFSYKANRLT